jgi:hypothetical protein
MFRFAIGVALVTAGLALMAISNKQLIAAAECEDCDDEVTETPIYTVSDDVTPEVTE